MANKEISGLTAAATLDGTETLLITQGGNSRRATSAQLGVWRHDTLTITAAASATWAIPADVTEIILRGNDINGSTTSQILTVALNKASDGTAASIHTMVTVFQQPTATTNAASANSGSTGIQILGADGTLPDFGVDLSIMFPRSASVKTNFAFYGMCFGGSPTNDIFRMVNAIAATAEDHDEIAISVNTGTLTGTFNIFYR